MSPRASGRDLMDYESLQWKNLQVAPARDIKGWRLVSAGSSRSYCKTETQLPPSSYIFDHSHSDELSQITVVSSK